MALFIGCWMSQQFFMQKPSSKTKHAFRCTCYFRSRRPKLSRCVCPLGFFDPLKLSPTSEDKFKFSWPKSHGRVAMLASVIQLQSLPLWAEVSTYVVYRLSTNPLANVLALCSRSPWNDRSKYAGHIQASNRWQTLVDEGRIWTRRFGIRSVRFVSDGSKPISYFSNKRTEQWPCSHGRDHTHGCARVDDWNQTVWLIPPTIFKEKPNVSICKNYRLCI